jgi:hypothetical protein
MHDRRQRQMCIRDRYLNAALAFHTNNARWFGSM